MVIPRVLDENWSLFLNLCQHGLQIESDYWLIDNKGINILISQMTLDNV